MSPEALLHATEAWLGGPCAAQELLYVATDETNLAWFEPLKQRHPQLRFLKDFGAETAGLPVELLGMVEQVVQLRVAGARVPTQKTINRGNM